jgi:DNA polymerase eta
MSSLVRDKLLERYPELSLPPPYNDNSYPLPPAPSVTFSDELGAIVPLSDGHSEEDPVDWDDVVMYLAAEMIREVRKEVEEKLGYTCSAGIARNKMLAKLAAGWKKPNQQVSVLWISCLLKTLLRNRAVLGFLKDFKFTKIRICELSHDLICRESGW